MLLRRLVPCRTSAGNYEAQEVYYQIVRQWIADGVESTSRPAS
jgi:hypothetical protein